MRTLYGCASQVGQRGGERGGAGEEAERDIEVTSALAASAAEVRLCNKDILGLHFADVHDLYDVNVLNKEVNTCRCDRSFIGRVYNRK